MSKEKKSDKTLILILSVVILFVLVYFAYPLLAPMLNQSNSTVDNGTIATVNNNSNNNINNTNGNNVTNKNDSSTFVNKTGEEGLFAYNVYKANSIAIVMDVRGVSSANISDNILQCGVDFAGSSGLADKNKTILSFSDGDKCVGIKNMTNLTVDDCLNLLSDDVIIMIREGDFSTFHTTSLTVGINEGYAPHMCGFKSNIVNN